MIETRDIENIRSSICCKHKIGLDIYTCCSVWDTFGYNSRQVLNSYNFSNITITVVEGINEFI